MRLCLQLDNRLECRNCNLHLRSRHLSIYGLCYKACSRVKDRFIYASKSGFTVSVSLLLVIAATAPTLSIALARQIASPLLDQCHDVAHTVSFPCVAR